METLILKKFGKYNRDVMHEHESLCQPGICASISDKTTWSMPYSSTISKFISNEAKKLEKQIQSRIRHKSRVERSNQQLLDARETNRRKKARWEEQLKSAQSRKRDRSNLIRMINVTRVQVHDQLSSQVASWNSQRKEGMIAKKIDEELRLQERLSRRGSEFRDKPDLWQEKYSGIVKRLTMKEQERHVKGSQLLSRLDRANTLFHERKSRRIRLQQLKGGEVNLRLIDALEKKRRLDAMQHDKLGQISELIHDEDDRQLSEHFAKEEILKRRKAVSELTRLTTPVTAPLKLSPGPGEYDPAPFDEVAAFPFSRAVPVDGLFQPRNPDVPAPGSYDPPNLAAGVVLSFAEARKTSYLDEQQRMKKQLPGPASYDLSLPLPQTAPKIVPNCVPHTASRAQQWVTGEAVPGPGTYTVDEFMKTEKVMRAISTADMFKNLFAAPARTLPPIVPDYDLEV